MFAKHGEEPRKCMQAEPLKMNTKGLINMEPRSRTAAGAAGTNMRNTVYRKEPMIANSMFARIRSRIVLRVLFVGLWFAAQNGPLDRFCFLGTANFYGEHLLSRVLGYDSCTSSGSLLSIMRASWMEL